MRIVRLLATFFVALLMLGLPTGMIRAASSSNSIASSLSVSIVPPTLPSDGRSHSVAVVSLQDANGKQTVALNDTLVYLTSSQEAVAIVQGSVTIAAGQSYVVANVTVTLTPGSTTITASSVGLGSAFGHLTTKVPSGFPTSLAIFSSPPVQPVGKSVGKLVVEILDQLGRPTRAASPTSVLLSSSNNSVVKPDVSSFTVPVNQTLVMVSYTSNSYGPAPGVATITASASGFNSGYAQLTVSNSTGRAAARLLLVPDPTELIADGRDYGALTVMLLDNNGSATKAPPISSGVYVQLTSSQPSVLSVPPVVLIPPGRGFVLVNVTSSVSPGSLTITATSPGLASSSAAMTTVAPAPSRLALYVAPDVAVVTGRGSRALLYVQLQDGDGNPALGRRATTVIITSSNSSQASFAVKLTVPRGQDYAVAGLDISGGSVGTLTASSSGLRSSNATLSSFMAPLQASLSTASPSIYQNQTDLVTLTVYALGVPLKGVSVTWTSSGGTVTGGGATTDSTGRATALFTPTSAGPATVTAALSSQALGPSNLTSSVLVLQVPPKHEETLVERVLSYWLYIVPAVVVAVVVTLFLVVRRRRRGEEVTEDGFEASG